MKTPAALCRHATILTSVLCALPVEQPGCLRGQQRTSSRGVLQQHLQLLQFGIAVQRRQRSGHASQGLGKKHLRFCCCHVSGGRRATISGSWCRAQRLMELLTAWWFRWAGVRSGCTRRGTLVAFTLLLLRWATVPGGSQCCSGPGSGIPGKDVFTYLSEIFENGVIRKVNNNTTSVYFLLVFMWTD